MAKRKTVKARSKAKAKVKLPPKAKDKGKVVPLHRQGSWPERIKQFLYEVKVEFKKVTWPTKKETIGTTVAVISFSVFVASYLGIIDILLSKIVQWLVY